MKLRWPIIDRRVVFRLLLHIPSSNRLLLLCLVHGALHLLQPDLLIALALLVHVDHSDVIAVVVGLMCLRIINLLLVEANRTNLWIRLLRLYYVIAYL